MNAKEAREKAELINERDATAELKVVKEYIAKDVERGLFSCDIYESLSDLTQAKLEADGYKLDYRQGGYNDYYWRISW